MWVEDRKIILSGMSHIVYTPWGSIIGSIEGGARSLDWCLYIPLIPLHYINSPLGNSPPAFGPNIARTVGQSEHSGPQEDGLPAYINSAATLLYAFYTIHRPKDARLLLSN